MKKILPVVVLSAAVALAQSAAADEVALKALHNPTGVFPTRMLEEGFQYGEVKALVKIDPEGVVSDFLILAYSQEGFANEVRRVLPDWRFAPPTYQGKPVSALGEFTFEFETRGIVVRKVTVDFDSSQIETQRGYAYQPCPADLLDRRITAVRQVAPSYPVELGQRKGSGRVRVQFYIDEAGRPRLPAPVGDSDEEFAGPAVAALEQWRFEPPTSHGRPVLVHAVKDFIFAR